MPVRLDGFRPEYLDFERGVRVGHLEPHERITQILKLSLEERYSQTFVTDRYGRGIYWQWICFLPKANRLAKPITSHVNFGCAKFFIMVDTSDRLFKTGMQVERGFINTDTYPKCILAEDWDWHRLVAAVRPRSRFYGELKRLFCEEEFEVTAGNFDKLARYKRANFPTAVALRDALVGSDGSSWAGFQLYYPMTSEEVKSSKGQDLVEAMLAIFEEVTPAMNECMDVQLTADQLTG